MMANDWCLRFEKRRENSRKKFFFTAISLSKKKERKTRFARFAFLLSPPPLFSPKKTWLFTKVVFFLFKNLFHSTFSFLFFEFFVFYLFFFLRNLTKRDSDEAEVLWLKSKFYIPAKMTKTIFFFLRKKSGGRKGKKVFFSRNLTDSQFSWRIFFFLVFLSHSTPHPSPPNLLRLIQVFHLERRGIFLFSSLFSRSFQKKFFFSYASEWCGFVFISFPLPFLDRAQHRFLPEKS